jgi:Kef-type K+ transport system membrane component KefB
MSLPAKLRVAGWVVSLGGAAMLVFGGGIGGGFNTENAIWPMIGAVIMVLGIIVTSTSPLVATLQERRRISERLAQLRSAPPETPAPPK